MVEGLESLEPRAETSESRVSIRLRIRAWNAAVITLTVAALTGAGIQQERQQLLRTERAHAEALLDHLAHMPEFGRDAQTAGSRLGLLRDSLHAVGSELELVPRREGTAARAGDPGGILATRQLSLREGAFDLRYPTDPERLRSMTRRSLLTHLLYGLLALAALVAGTEWILRRNLVVPLRSLSQQLHRMREGGGWLSKAPPTDEELAGLASAVADLGPGLEPARLSRSDLSGPRRRGATSSGRGRRREERSAHAMTQMPRNGLRRYTAAAAVAVFLATGLAAQTPPAPPLQRGIPRYRVDVDLVRLSVTARDARGALVHDLQPEEFRVLEDDVEQEIAQFGHHEAPISVVVLFDKSSSMEGEKLMHAKDAVINFVRAFRRQDEVLVIAFSDSIDVLGGFGLDVRTIERATKRIKVDGTGGWTYLIAAAKRCKEVCVRVAEELRNQYLLGYSPANRARDGRWRTIAVRTTRPGVTLATRSGYYAGGSL